MKKNLTFILLIITLSSFEGIITQAGKLKVRGIFKTSLFAFAMGISINFGRIYRLLLSQNGNFIDFLTNFNTFACQILFFVNLSPNTARRNKMSSKVFKYRIYTN